jgi:hypothetical protein
MSGAAWVVIRSGYAQHHENPGKTARREIGGAESGAVAGLPAHLRELAARLLSLPDAERAELRRLLGSW